MIWANSCYDGMTIRFKPGASNTGPSYFKARAMIAAFICGAPIPPEGARETIISICRARGFKL